MNEDQGKQHSQENRLFNILQTGQPGRSSQPLASQAMIQQYAPRPQQPGPAVVQSTSTAYQQAASSPALAQQPRGGPYRPVGAPAQHRPAVQTYQDQHARPQMAVQGYPTASASMYGAQRPVQSVSMLPQHYLLNNLRSPILNQQYMGQAVQQLSEEDRKVLPRKSLKRKAVSATDEKEAELDASLESALVQLAEEFITGAVAFACGLSRRRKSTRLEAADVAMYLDRTWQLRIPGFSGSQVKPYKRPSAAAMHQERRIAIRKETTAASEAASAAAQKSKSEGGGIKLLPG